MVGILLDNILFTKIYYIGLYRICVIFTTANVYGKNDAYKSMSSAANFIFTVTMKVRVKPSVFTSKF